MLVFSYYLIDLWRDKFYRCYSPRLFFFSLCKPSCQREACLCLSGDVAALLEQSRRPLHAVSSKGQILSAVASDSGFIFLSVKDKKT